MVRRPIEPARKKSEASSLTSSTDLRVLQVKGARKSLAGAYNALASGSFKRSLSRRFSFRSPKVLPPGPPSGPQNILEGKKMAKQMWIRGTPTYEVESMRPNDEKLSALAQQLSERFRDECSIFITQRGTYGGSETHLVGISKGRALIAVYEVHNQWEGVMFKRVCDQPVRELLRLGKLPVPPAGNWPEKYEPVNTFGGNRKLPSRSSVKDIMDF